MRTYEEQRLADISKDLDSMRKSLTNISQCLTGIDRNLKRLADAKNPFDEETGEVENSFERLGEKDTKAFDLRGLIIYLREIGYSNLEIANALSIPEADVKAI